MRPGLRLPGFAPPMMAQIDVLEDALRAAALVALDPGLGGILLRARVGEMRSLWEARHREIAPRPIRRVPPGIADDRLLGGLDLAATLGAGRPVISTGLIAEVGRGTLILPMAERASAGTAARIAAALDEGTGLTVLALDEGIDVEERCPAALSDRLAFHIDFTGVEGRSLPDLPMDLDRARAALSAQPADPGAAELFASAAGALGIASLRAPLFALAAARADAALAGRASFGEVEAARAARLVLGPRATQMPEVDMEDADEPPPPPDPPQDGQQEGGQGQGEVAPDQLIEAVRASLPPEVLARLRTASLRTAAGGRSGAGALQSSGRRGRPAGVRRGDPRGPDRVDLVATLRTAAPWQPLRRSLAPEPPDHFIVTQDDIRVRRHVETRERLAIFVVDASGSAAMARLGEAKGAVELMLAEAYVGRDQVALIAVRGRAAELLLPPTRSLVQTKRRLAALPGGGGTPLASGLEAALALAERARRRGTDPVLVLLTDGRANVARDGREGRAAAREDTLAAARALRAASVPGVLIDTSARPQASAAALAEAMGARYLPLPRADARGIQRAAEAVMAR
ncbi:MAG: magnesium chelatase subunit D [Pseudomonadota bacterium]